MWLFIEDSLTAMRRRRIFRKIDRSTSIEDGIFYFNFPSQLAHPAPYQTPSTGPPPPAPPGYPGGPPIPNHSLNICPLDFQMLVIILPFLGRFSQIPQTTISHIVANLGLKIDVCLDFKSNSVFNTRSENLKSSTIKETSFLSSVYSAK